jgi:tRNA 5-methylaminomethyl-2-thiouridine biosynthesis bifunctional protein
VLSTCDHQQNVPETRYPSLSLHHAGAVAPHQLRDEILQHPKIKLVKAKISRLAVVEGKAELWQDQQQIATADHVIVCCAKQSAELFEHYPVLKPIRGQVSWVANSTQALPLDQAYSYGGYCMQLDASQLILGASFHPNRDDVDILNEDHVHNYELIHSVFPEYAQQLPAVETWQGRASVRAQSLDYFPLVGKMDNDGHISTFAGLGSKGFLFAPLCSEVLVALVLGELCPVPQNLLNKLSPQRFQKKVKTKKPYYSG